MTPRESNGFLTALALVAGFWVLGGAYLWGDDPGARNVFFRVFLWIALDLFFLVWLFWQLFFSQNRDLLWKVRVGVSFTFKLVCLGFLAITLKESRNEPHIPAVAGVLFLVVGPLMSALAVRVLRATKDRKSGTRV